MLDKLDNKLLILIVKNHVQYYLMGMENALTWLGDSDHSTFAKFAKDDLGISVERAKHFRHLQTNRNTVKDYRGLLCMIMDDLGLRDHDKRDSILECLTGQSREDIFEAERLHRISQGDINPIVPVDK